MNQPLRFLLFFLVINLAFLKISRADVLDFKLQNASGLGVHIKPVSGPGTIQLIAIDNAVLKPDLTRFLKTNLQLNSTNEAPQTTYLLFVGDPSNRQRLIKLFGEETVLFDYSEVVARAFKLRRNLDFIVLRRQDFSILAEGNLSTQSPRSSQLKTSPPFLQLLDPRKLNFRTQVLPAFSQNCMECHAHLNTQQLFTDIESVRNWRAMMLKSIRLGLMPAGFDPFDAPLIGKTRVHDLRILVSWLDAGAPTVKKDEPLVANQFRTLKSNDILMIKKLGTPDIEAEYPEEIEIPPVGKKITRVYEFPFKTSEDQLIEKVYVVSKATSMHHLRFFASTQSLKQEGSFLYLPNPIYERASATLDGKIIRAAGTDNSHQVAETSRLSGFVSNYPCYENVCYRSLMPKNSVLTIQVHYLPNGLKEKDRPKLLIYFAKKDGKIRKPLKKILLMPHFSTFRIPPHSGPVTLHMEYPIKKRSVLLGYSMHAHLRATNTRFFVKDQTGKSSPVLFSLPFFYYMIQPQKFLNEPITLEPDTNLVSEVTYDNTAANDANPNPDAEVTMGENPLEQDTHAASVFLYEMEKK